MLPVTERIALVVSPHPDDELIPAGGTLLRLRSAGWRIVNLACGLGRPEHHERRRRELTAACARAGFELRPLEPPLALSRDDDLAEAQRRLEAELANQLHDLRPPLLLAPGPRDGHHAHELVARAVQSAVATHGGERTVWWWELWGHLVSPTLLVDVSAQLNEVCAALREHAGELERNDYERLVRTRAAAASVLGPERVFGYGATGGGARHVEVLSETVFTGGGWQLASPRWLDDPGSATTGKRPPDP